MMELMYSPDENLSKWIRNLTMRGVLGEVWIQLSSRQTLKHWGSNLLK